MEIEIIKQEPGYIKFNGKFTDPHTLPNLVYSELLEDEDVDFAGYWRDKSFYESYIFQVRMKKEEMDPVDAINRALDRINEISETFIDVVKSKIS